jgi:hypothetical protein
MSRRRGKAPDGWELIESTIEELNAKMKEATSETHEGRLIFIFLNFISHILFICLIN